MKRILVSCRIFPEVIDKLAQYFEVDANPGDMLSSAELSRRLMDKDGAFVAGDPISASVLSSAPKLKVVSNMIVGYNNFDIPAFTARGVLATNTPDVLTETTADLGWGLMMAAARRIAEADRFIRTGQWRKSAYDSYLGVDLFGSTLGVIGMGRIGQALARRAKGFNMRILYNNRSPIEAKLANELGAQFVSKTDLLMRSDHVVLTLPYSIENHHAIGVAELALMKPTATLTNFARGGIVDDVALIDALQNKRIGAAGLDVFEGEPNLNPGFLALANVVLTPHIGTATSATRLAMANLAADNLIAGLGYGPNAGHPPNPINPEVLARS